MYKWIDIDFEERFMDVKLIHHTYIYIYIHFERLYIYMYKWMDIDFEERFWMKKDIDVELIHHIYIYIFIFILRDCTYIYV